MYVYVKLPSCDSIITGATLDTLRQSLHTKQNGRWLVEAAAISISSLSLTLLTNRNAVFHACAFLC